MTKTEVICDVCGTRKGDSNHWYKVGIKNKILVISDRVGDINESPKDICGRLCLMRIIEEAIEKGEI